MTGVAPGRSNSSRLRSGVAYAVAASIQRGSIFLLLPFLTRAISPEEYGRLSVVLSMAAIASIVFAVGLDVAVFRAYFQLAGDPGAQRLYVNSVWTFLMVVPFGGAIVAGTLILPIAQAASIEIGELFLGLFGAALFVSASTVPMAVLRAAQRSAAYIAVVTVMTAVTSAGILFFVLAARFGTAGWLAGIAAGNVAGLAATAVIVPWRRPIPFDRAGLLWSLRYGLPLVPHAAAQWALQLADRLVLSDLVGYGRLGIYSLAANFAVPAFVVVLSLNQGLMPGYARAATEAGDGEDLALLGGIQATIVVTTCTALALLVPDILELVVDPAYAPAGGLVSWLVLGYLFLGLYYIPMNWLTLTAGESKRVWIFTVLCAVTNLVLLYALVPIFGLTSAAIAAAIAYLELLVMVGTYAKHKGNPVVYDWRRLTRLAVIAAAAYGAATVTTTELPAASSLGVRCAWLLAMLAGLVMGRVVDLPSWRRWPRH